MFCEFISMSFTLFHLYVSYIYQLIHLSIHLSINLFSHTFINQSLHSYIYQPIHYYLFFVFHKFTNPSTPFIISFFSPKSQRISQWPRPSHYRQLDLARRFKVQRSSASGRRHSRILGNSWRFRVDECNEKRSPG